jgi:hypothetical protein
MVPDHLWANKEQPQQAPSAKSELDEQDEKE